MRVHANRTSSVRAKPIGRLSAWWLLYMLLCMQLHKGIRVGIRVGMDSHAYRSVYSPAAAAGMAVCAAIPRH